MTSLQDEASHWNLCSQKQNDGVLTPTYADNSHFDQHPTFLERFFRGSPSNGSEPELALSKVYATLRHCIFHGLSPLTLADVTILSHLSGPMGGIRVALNLQTVQPSSKTG